MLPIIALVVVVAIVILLGVAAAKPDTFEVSRTETIRAPAAAIYPFIIDFRQWSRWSPWEQLDPDMRRTHSGAPAGAGAIYEWQGNRKAGQGRMEITETRPPEHVVIALEFIKPFAATNTTAFHIEPGPEGSRVTWSMHGPNTFAGKLMGVFVDMESMIGREYERGLAALKLTAEHEAAESPENDLPSSSSVTAVEDRVPPATTG